MDFLLDHKKTIIAGFILTAIILAAAAVTGDGLDASLLIGESTRWLHVMSGIIWIGLLYYFNFVQVPSLGGVTAETKADLFKEGSIVRRALHWFRFGAMFTLLFGLILAWGLYKNGGGAAFSVDIMIGMTFGIIMWANVTFIIWPNQQKVIGMVEATAEEKAAAGKKALLSSRTSTLLSIPMLLTMVTSAHGSLF